MACTHGAERKRDSANAGSRWSSARSGSAGSPTHGCSTRCDPCRASGSCRRRRAQAYDDAPLAIGFGQTISQPHIVAYMTEALECPARRIEVLEIGTGSGYQAAVLGELAREVYTIEIVPELAEARQRAARAELRKRPRPRGRRLRRMAGAGPLRSHHRHGCARRDSAPLIEQLRPAAGS